MTEEVHLETATAENGERLLRAALSLSLLTGKSLRVSGFQSREVKPGLQRRHMTMLDLAVAVGRAKIDGMELGSTAFRFRPAGVFPGQFTFSVGNAGSAFELLESVALPLCFAHQSSKITVFGITHTANALSFEQFGRTIVPLYRSGGLDIDVTLHHAGFAPHGVGKVSLNTAGGQLLKRYHLAERGALRSKKVIAMVRSLTPYRYETAREKLGTAYACEEQAVSLSVWPASNDTLDTVVVELQSEFVVQSFSGFVTNGHNIYEVAAEVSEQAEQYLTTGAAVTAEAAETLLPIMCAAGGGTFIATSLTDEARAIIGLCKEFYPVRIKLSRADEGVEVAVRER